MRELAASTEKRMLVVVTGHRVCRQAQAAVKSAAEGDEGHDKGESEMDTSFPQHFQSPPMTSRTRNRTF